MTKHPRYLLIDLDYPDVREVTDLDPMDADKLIIDLKKRTYQLPSEDPKTILRFVDPWSKHRD
jgi:hypothetical protein